MMLKKVRILRSQLSIKITLTIVDGSLLNSQAISRRSEPPTKPAKILRGSYVSVT